MVQNRRSAQLLAPSTLHAPYATVHRAWTELTLRHLGREDSGGTCRTLDFLQDRQAKRGCLLRYDTTALQLRGGERRGREGRCQTRQHTYRLIKVIKQIEKHSSTSRTQTNILMLPCVFQTKSLTLLKLYKNVPQVIQKAKR